MNKWKEKLGCEVQECAAANCDEGRLRICYLRRCYMERVELLKIEYHSARGDKTRRIYLRELKRMGVEIEGSTSNPESDDQS